MTHPKTDKWTGLLFRDFNLGRETHSFDVYPGLTGGCSKLHDPLTRDRLLTAFSSSPSFNFQPIINGFKPTTQCSIENFPVTFLYVWLSHNIKLRQWNSPTKKKLPILTPLKWWRSYELPYNCNRKSNHTIPLFRHFQAACHCRCIKNLVTFCGWGACPRLGPWQFVSAKVSSSNSWPKFQSYDLLA